MRRLMQELRRDHRSATRMNKIWSTGYDPNREGNRPGAARFLTAGRGDRHGWRASRQSRFRRVWHRPKNVERARATVREMATHSPAVKDLRLDLTALGKLPRPNYRHRRRGDRRSTSSIESESRGTSFSGRPPGACCRRSRYPGTQHPRHRSTQMGQPD